MDCDEDEVMNIFNYFFFLFKGFEKFYIGLIKIIYYLDSWDNFYFLWFIVGYYGFMLKNLVIYL